MIIETPETEIKLSEGRFALEYHPNRTPWFYLFYGEAEVRSRKMDETLVVQPETMVALLESNQLFALPYDPDVVNALDSTIVSPISTLLQPSRIEYVSAWLSRLGINIALLITFVTYAPAV